MGSSSSTLEFRQQINLLNATSVSPNNHEFWKVVFLAAMSRDEVFAMVQPRDVRIWRTTNQHNLSTFLFKCVEQLYTFVKHSKEVNDTRSVRNSIWILTRVMPFVLEEAGANEPENATRFCEAFFHKNLTCNATLPGERYGTIGNDELTQPLWRVLAHTLLKLCFVPGYTLGTGSVRDGTKASWYPSLDPDTYGNVWASSSDILENRLDVLRCILLCSCGSLFTQNALATNTFLAELTSPEAPHSAQLFHSLLSVVTALNPRGTLPYATSFLADHTARIADLSLHVLIVALDYAEGSASHAWWVSLNTLGQEPCNRLLSHLTNLIRLPVDANNTYLPGSQTSIPYTREALVLLWKVIDRNPMARTTLIRSSYLLDAVIAVIANMLECRHDASRFGELQVCTFILLAMSGERDFCVAIGCASIPNLRLSLPIAVQGSFNDLIIVTMHTLCTFNKPWLRPFVDCWMTIISNVSPYMKALSMGAAVKIMGLFDTCTAATYMAKGPRAMNHVALLLESVCNAVQYQYDACVTLVYCVLRSPAGLERLKAFTSTTPPPEGWTKQLSGLLNTLLRLNAALAEKMEHLVVTTDKDLLDFLLKTTVVGLLPVPHPILIRRFESQPQTQHWLSTWTWGLVYLRNLVPPLFDASVIRLFQVTASSHTPPVGPPKQPLPAAPAPADATTS